MKIKLTTDPIIGFREIIFRETMRYETASYTYFVKERRLAIIPFVAFEWRRDPWSN